MKQSNHAKLKSTETRKATLALLKPGAKFNLVRARLEELIIQLMESPDRRGSKVRPIAMEKCRELWNGVADNYVSSNDVIRELLRSPIGQHLSDELRLAQRAKDQADENYLRLLSKAMESLAEEIALEQKLQPDAEGHLLIC